MNQEQDELKIIEVTPQTEIIITPCNFLFPPTYDTEWGCLANDGKHHVYVYPIKVNFDENDPVRFLKGALKVGHGDFDLLIFEAYMRHWNIRIGGQLVLWSEYEAIFSGFYWYRPNKKRAKVVSMEYTNMESRSEERRTEDSI